ncbi:MAG: barstar family protein [Clostridia bacterium]|nr:barstar family protein [Clostridia bacterium]
MIYTNCFIIDASLFTSKSDMHELLQKVFSEYEYFGKNLDALHDVLTSIRKDSLIVINNFAKAQELLGAYMNTTAKVFCNSAEENPHLKIVFNM